MSATYCLVPERRWRFVSHAWPSVPRTAGLLSWRPVSAMETFEDDKRLEQRVSLLAMSKRMEYLQNNDKTLLREQMLKDQQRAWLVQLQAEDDRRAERREFVLTAVSAEPPL